MWLLALQCLGLDKLCSKMLFSDSHVSYLLFSQSYPRFPRIPKFARCLLLTVHGSEVIFLLMSVCLSLNEFKYSLDRRRHALQVLINVEARILMPFPPWSSLVSIKKTILLRPIYLCKSIPIIPQSLPIIPALFLDSLAYLLFSKLCRHNLSKPSNIPTACINFCPLCLIL